MQDFESEERPSRIQGEKFRAAVILLLGEGSLSGRNRLEHAATPTSTKTGSAGRNKISSIVEAISAFVMA